MRSRPVRMSSLVSTRSVMPLMRAAYRVTGASYQPTRRGRPVVVPNSKPRERSHSPCSSNSSVGKGPDPTDRERVVSGKRVSVRVDLGGRRILRKKIKEKQQEQMNKN